MNKRPLWFIMMTCFILLYQIVWLISVLQLPDDLKDTVSLSVPFEVIVSGAIVTFFTVGLRALILTRPWAIRYTVGVIAVLWMTIILRLIVFAEADYDRQRLPFLVFITIVVCGLMVLPKLVKTIHKSTKGENSYDPNP